MCINLYKKNLKGTPDKLYAFILQQVLTNLHLVTMLLHQPGPQLKLPSWRNKSIYAISM